MAAASPLVNTFPTETVRRYLRIRVESRYPGSRPVPFYIARDAEQGEHFKVFYIPPASYDSEQAVASRQLLIKDLHNYLPDADITPCCDSPDSGKLGFIVKGNMRKIAGNIHAQDPVNFPRMETGRSR